MLRTAPVYDVEQRLLLGTLSICVVALLALPGINATFIHESWTYRVVRFIGVPYIVQLSFLVPCGLILPLVFNLRKQLYLKMACFGGCLGSFACFGVAYISRDLDLGRSIASFLNGFSFYFIMIGFVCLMFSLAISILLNGQMRHFFNADRNRRLGE